MCVHREIKREFLGFIFFGNLCNNQRTLLAVSNITMKRLLILLLLLPIAAVAVHLRGGLEGETEVRELTNCLMRYPCLP
jgi:hypothetical protein